MYYLVEFDVAMIFFEVDSKCKWNHLVETDLFAFTVLLQIEEELIFGGQCSMSIDMIDQLFVAKLAKSFKVDAIRGGFPLEIEQIGGGGLFPRGEVLRHIWL